MQGGSGPPVPAALAPRELSTWGQDEDWEGEAGLGRRPVSTPRSGSISRSQHPQLWRLAPQTDRPHLPQPSGTGCRDPALPGRGEGRARPDLPWFAKSRGWGQAGGSMPFPGPRRKGLCGAVTFLGRGLASSPSPCRGAEARGQGGGDSQWTSVPAHKGPLWPSSWLPYSGPQSPARQESRPAWSLRLGAGRAALTSTLPWCRSLRLPLSGHLRCLGLLSLSLRGTGSWFWRCVPPWA